MSEKSTNLDVNSPIIGTIPESKKNKEFSELFKKKLLKGKLIKLINESLIQTNVETNQGRNEHKTINSRTNKIRNFSVEAFPSILGRDNRYSSLRSDKYVTPQELVSNNFNKSEILQINSNQAYFKLPETFQELDYFKKKKLIDVLEKEDYKDKPKREKVSQVPRCYFSSTKSNNY